MPDWLTWYRKAVQKNHLKPSLGEYSHLHIVFVSARPRIREAKLAKAAQSFGHRVSLVASMMPLSNEYENSFDACYRADSPWKTLAILRDIKPDVVHLFALYNNVRILPLLIFSEYPVIYDPYDCLKGMFKDRYKPNIWEVLAEKECFVRATHICARSLEPYYLRKHFHYRMSTATYWPEYCWSKPMSRAPRSIKLNHDLHVVYCGGVWPEDKYPSEKLGYSQHIEVGRVLARQKIHLHIYPASTGSNINFEDFFCLYLKEAKDNQYFHIYRTLPHNKLIDTIAKYDAALHAFGINVNYQIGRSTEAKVNYSSANKLFDYIEAGLPVIIHRGNHQAGVVKHYGTAIQVETLENIRPALVRAINEKREVKNGCDLEYHAPRLSEMYYRVAGEEIK